MVANRVHRLRAGARCRQATVALVSALLGTACAVLPSPVQSDQTQASHFDLRYGVTDLRQAEHEPVEELSMVGIYFQHDWLEFGVFEGSDESDVTVDMGGVPTELGVRTELSEVSIGYRKTFRENSDVQPFIGVGAAHIRAELSRVVGSTWVQGDEKSLGAYGLVGVRMLSSRDISFDIGLRGLFGTKEIEFSGYQSDLDYVQAYISVGTSF
jgi:hypothetical protein